MKRRELAERIVGLEHRLYGQTQYFSGLRDGLQGLTLHVDPGTNTYTEGMERGLRIRESLTAAREQQTREQEPTFSDCATCDTNEYAGSRTCPEHPDGPPFEAAQEPVEDEPTYAQIETERRDWKRWCQEAEQARDEAIERAEREQYEANNRLIHSETRRIRAEHERDGLRAAIERHRELQRPGLSRADLSLWAVLSKRGEA